MREKKYTQTDMMEAFNAGMNKALSIVKSEHRDSKDEALNFFDWLEKEYQIKLK